MRVEEGIAVVEADDQSHRDLGLGQAVDEAPAEGLPPERLAPLLDVVMSHADNNQSRAAEWLGLNRNTLRKKLVEHKLL